MPESLKSQPRDPGSVTVIITTRNRKADLCLAIDSILRQSIRVQILVMDDASTDGTSELLAERYPMVDVNRSETRLGLIVQRNRATELARGSIVISLDDDAIFTEPTTIAKALEPFKDPRVGAVSIPIVNIIGEDRSRPGAAPVRTPGTHLVPAYIGAGHALDRDLFLRLGGYENGLFQWGEETNYCVKLYGNGYVVAMADCADVEHRPNPAGRHTRAKNVWIYRNSIVNVVLLAPAWLVPPLCALETARFLIAGIRRPRKLPVILEGLARGYGWSLAHLSKRSAVGTRAYLAYLHLRRRKVESLSQFEARLPRAGWNRAQRLARVRPSTVPGDG